MASTRKIETAEWEQHKTEIEALYLKQSQSVEQLRQSMEDSRGFFASKAQYVRKLKQWGFEKNTSSETWKYIAHQLQKRKMEGKESNAYIHGKLVPQKKVKREISRYDLPTFAQKNSVSSLDPPGGITVSTPSCDSLSVVDYLHIPWLEFQTLVEPLLERFRMSVAGNLNEPWPSAYHHSPAAVSMQQSFHNGDQRTFETSAYLPGPASLFQSSSSVSLREQICSMQYVNPKTLSYNYMDYDVSPTSTSFRPSREARHLLAECLGTEIDPDSRDFASQISDCLSDAMIEVHCDILKLNISKLCGISSLDASIEFIRYSIYLSSNSLLSDAQTDNFLKWTLKNRFFWILEALLKLKIPTVELLASNLLLSAIRQNELDVVRTILAIGVNINASAGQNPSQCALRAAVDKPIGKQDINLLQLLLDFGADPSLNNDLDVCSIIKLTARRGCSPNYIQKLVEGGADPDHVLNNPRFLIKVLEKAISEVKFEILRVLLAKATKIQSPEIRNDLIQEIAFGSDIDLVELIFRVDRVLWISAGLNEIAIKKKECQLERIFQELIHRSSSELRWVMIKAREIRHSSLFALVCGNPYHVPQNPLLLFLALDKAVQENEILDVRMLLHAGALVSEHFDNSEKYSVRNVLHIATTEGHVSLVKILLESGADINASQLGWTALQHAAQDDHIDVIKVLLNAGADINSPASSFYGRTALQVAAECAKIETVKLLLSAGAEVNAPASKDGGRTALQAAAESGRIEILQLLLSAGAEVNAPASKDGGRTALQAAAESGRIEILQLLLSAGAEVNAPASKDGGRTALQAAAESGHIKMMELLLRAGAEINAHAGGIGGRTALQSAVAAHNIEAVDILLKAGADVDAPTFEGEGLSILYAAFQCSLRGCEIVERLLLRITHLSDQKGKQAALEWAVHFGKVDAVKYLLESGTDPNTPGKGIFKSALIEAVWIGSLEIAVLLLNSGAAINEGLSYLGNTTPLQCAIMVDDIDMVNFLIARGADQSCSVVTYEYFSPENYGSLGAAIYHDASIEIIHALVDAGANVNGKGPNKRTPLQAASGIGRMDIAKMLLDAGANINAQPAAQGGHTALQAAVNAQNLHMVRFLLQNGAEVNAPAAEFWGATALQRAAIEGHLRITLELLEAGADTHAPGAREEGRIALEAAAEHGRLDILHLLLKNDTQKDTLGVRCEEAAKLATKKRRPVIARILGGYVKS